MLGAEKSALLFFFGKAIMRIAILSLIGLLAAGCSNITSEPPQEDEGPVSIITGKPGGIKPATRSIQEYC